MLQQVRSEFVFLLVKSYSVLTVYLYCTVRKAFFLCFSRSILITYLTTLSLEKIYCFQEKILEKVLSFGSKNLYEPCIEQPTFKMILVLLSVHWSLSQGWPVNTGATKHISRSGNFIKANLHVPVSKMCHLHSEKIKVLPGLFQQVIKVPLMMG